LGPQSFPLALAVAQDRRRRQAQTGEPLQGIPRFGKGDQRSHQANQRQEARAEAVGQTHDLIPGNVTEVAALTVVVGALQTDFALDGEDRASEVVHELGRTMAMATERARTYVPLFFRLAR